MKFIAIVCLIGLALILGLYGISTSTVSTVDKTQKKVNTTELHASKVLSGNSTESDLSCSKERYVTARDGKKFYSLGADNERLNALLERDDADIRGLVKQSQKGDGAAAIVLHQMAGRCASTKQEADLALGLQNSRNIVCKLIPENIIKEPLLILKEAADAGSVQAKLYYAQSAIPVAARLRAFGTRQSSQQAAALLAQAEIYGEDAAQSGALEAWEFMTRAYHSGMFGRRDELAAYAHALPLALNDSTGAYSSFAKDLRRGLSDADANSVAKTSYICQATHEVSRNPFN